MWAGTWPTFHATILRSLLRVVLEHPRMARGRLFASYLSRSRHITSSVGSIGAAAAVAKILGLSVTEIAHAIGIAATQVVGLREMFGSHTKSFHPGRAAQCGLLAAFMAEGGYTSSDRALEAKRGWANVVGATKPDVQQNLEKWLGLEDNTVGLARDGAGRWEILRNSFKPFPCGIVVHPVIDACVRLHQDLATIGLVPSNIKTVVAKVHPLVLELTGKKEPQTGLEAKFSVYHGAACGLLFGKVTPAEFGNGVVKDTRVISLRDRIDAVISEKLAADQATVLLYLDNGQVLERHIDHAIGSIEVPMDDASLEKKFVGQCTPVLADGVKRASDACWAVENFQDISSITALL